MENNEKNQNTTWALPHILVRTHRFENDLFFLSNEGSFQIWNLTFPHYKFAWPRELKTRLLGNFEGFLTICQKNCIWKQFFSRRFQSKMRENKKYKQLSDLFNRKQ